VRLDLFGDSPHLLVLGDAACGKSSLLRLIARGLAARHPPDEVALLVVDLRRGLLDLTALPNLVAYACAATAIAQVVEQLRRQLEERGAGGVAVPPEPAAWAPDLVSSPVLAAPGGGLAPWAAADPPAAADGSAPGWVGPRYVVLVDDYDLLPAATGSPLLPLVDLLGLGSELGLHMVLARRVAGVARAGFEPVFQRLRELGGSGLVMRGDPAEGPVLGGQRAGAFPPGRGVFVRSRRPPTLVQVAYSPPGA
jgi:DNA segregation ATPase FtsK/SpoIIIE, S-DNA-T family